MKAVSVDEPAAAGQFVRGKRLKRAVVHGLHVSKKEIEEKDSRQIEE